MSSDELASDLAYARALAEEGRNAPLVGGSFGIMFGALLTVCYCLQWAVLTGRLPIDDSFIGLIWLGFGVCVAIGMPLLIRRNSRMPGRAAIPNRIDRNVWQGVSGAILAVVAGALARMAATGDFTAPNAIVASGFGLYGVALYVTATAGGHLWLRGFAIASWLLSAVLWFFLDQAWMYLVAAAGSLGVLLLPGILMMRREPRTIV